MKLIAEPWDVGEGGYQVGNFPPLWSRVERQVPRHRARLSGAASRRRWASSPRGSPAAPTSTRRSAGGRTPASTSSPRTTASRCATSSPTTRSTTRRTARTTATARAHNRSWNCGVEGPTDDPAISALRARQQRNFLATLLLSQGVPMLLAGDELGRTQGGNNNAYCQDNEMSWIDWEHADDGAARVHPAPDRAPPRPSGVPPAPLVPGPADPRRRRRDIAWFTPDGDEMTEPDWDGGLRQVARRLPERRGDSGRACAANRWSTTASFCSSTPTTNR